MGDDITLKLVLTEHWYDEYVSGRKRIEYRVMSPHWKRLIWNRRDRIKRVQFQRAFKKNPPKSSYEVQRIDIGICHIDGWDDHYYRIFLK